MTKLQKLRNRAFISQQGFCYYCLQPMWLRSIEELTSNYSISRKQARLLRATAEHLVGKCEGGMDHSSNIVAACSYCNSHRHRARVPLTPEAYRARVRKRLRRGSWHGVSITLRSR